jgi:putative two-component system response regulator
MRNILIVDDDEFVRDGITRLLDRSGYKTATAGDAPSAREVLRTATFDLVLCDIDMPGPSGLELLEQIAAELPDTATVMVTGTDDTDVARRALSLGAYGYVVKPFRPNELLINVMNALKHLDLEKERRMHSQEIESKLLQRNSSLMQAIKQLEIYESASELPWHETVDRLSRALALRDEETGRHIERVGLYCQRLAQKRGVTTWAPEVIRQASMLHDAGKIGISDSILLKPEALTDQEMSIVRRHAELGYQLLSGSQSPLLDLAASIALTHHENWDGTGYPRGLQGEEIPIEGRIAAISDVFDALTSDRVYRPAVPIDEALQMMRRDRGAKFDPLLIDLFMDSIDEFIAIREAHPDPHLGDGDRIQVVVVEDQDLFAEAMVRLLNTAEGVSVVGRAGSVEEAVRVVRDTRPDVVLLDWMLPDGKGGDAARAIRNDLPETKAIILSGWPDEDLLAEAIDAGCSAVLNKNRAFDELLHTIREVQKGDVTLPLSSLPSVLARIRTPGGPPGADLTARELEVLALLAEGLSTEAISERLVISVHTVRNHIQRIIMKLGAHSKLEAVSTALRQGIIGAPRPAFN